MQRTRLSNFSDHRTTLASHRRLQLIVTSLLVSLLTTSTSLAVKLGGNGVGDLGQLLELLIKVLAGGSGCVLLEPVLSLLDGVLERLLVILFDLAAEAFLIVDLVLEAV